MAQLIAVSDSTGKLSVYLIGAATPALGSFTVSAAYPSYAGVVTYYNPAGYDFLNESGNTLTGLSIDGVASVTLNGQAAFHLFDIVFSPSTDPVNVVLTAADASFGDANSSVIAVDPTLTFSASFDATATLYQAGTFTLATGTNVAVAADDVAYNVTGNAAANTITGGAAGGTIKGLGGADILNGGAGTDYASYAGNFADFEFHRVAAGQWTVKDLKTSDGLDEGTDTLTGVEGLKFADMPGGFLLSNLPTLASAISDQSSLEDTAWSFGIASAFAVENPSATLAYTARLADGSALPSWLQLDSTTGQFSGTPTLNWHGALDITVTASNGAIYATDSFRLTVANVDDAATGTLTTGGTVAEGGTVTSTLSASDVDGTITGTTYQWRISDNGTSGWADLAGATSSSYTIASDQSQIGKYLQLVAVTTDALGGQTTFTSGATAAIANVDDAATGTLTTGGTVAEGGTVTSTLSATDADGGISSTTYQWQISDNGTSGWTDLAGATSSGYTIASDQSQVGKYLHVVAVTTDAFGGHTTFTSSATAAIANVDDAATGTLTTSGTVAEGGTVTSSLSATDPDGAFTTAYQWQISSDGLTGWMDIPGATSSSYTIASDQSQVGKYLQLVAVTTDTFGGHTTFTSSATAAIANVDDAATGTLTTGGTVAEGGTVTSTLSATDVDGGISSTTYQWQISDNGASGWTDIAGATSSSYTIASDQSQVGKYVQLVAVTTDTFGGHTTFTSSATAAIANVDDAATGTLTTGGTVAEGGTVTSTLTATDADGAITGTAYQWQISSDGLTGWTDIAGATSSSYTIASDQSQVGKYLQVVAVTTDALGGHTAFTSSPTAVIANVDDAATGSLATAATASGVATATGTAVKGGTVNSTLTATDPDGSFTTAYQWQISDDGSTGWADIAGATSSSYTLASDNSQVGKYVQVVATTTDPFGGHTTFTSLATHVTSQAEVAGGSGNDSLVGAGKGFVSYITGGAGNDSITGGSRADVAVYSGNKADYTIRTVAGVTTVTDNRPGSPDGVDTLRGINILKFADVQWFQTTAANKVTLAGGVQTYEVANSELVQGTNAAEHFIIGDNTSADVLVGNGDVVDLSGSIAGYTFKQSGTALQIGDGTYTTTLNVGGAFTLRTADGSTAVAIDLAGGGVIKLGGTQVVGSVGFDALAAITNATDKSGDTAHVSLVAPTVDALSTTDTTPTITGTAVLGTEQALEVLVDGTVYTTANGLVLGAGNSWSLTLSTPLATGTYDVQARVVPATPDAPVAVGGTAGADTLTGVAGQVTHYTGGGGNDTITGTDRADVAIYSGNKADYTIRTVAGVTTVTDNRVGSPDGVDTLRGIDILKFADVQWFQTTAANKVTLAGGVQTYEVANSELVQGTNAAEHFIIESHTSADVLVGAGDVVDLSHTIGTYSFKQSGTALQISDGTFTTTLNVGGSFTLRASDGSTSVAIDLAGGGVIKLGGTQVVGSGTFDAHSAILNAADHSDNAIPLCVVDTTLNELFVGAVI